MISFPANFFTRSLSQEFYAPTSLSKSTTFLLLSVSLLLLIVGVLMLKPDILKYVRSRIIGGFNEQTVFEKRRDNLIKL